MGKPHSQRREEIIRSVLQLAAENGIKKITTQAIADRVGIAQPTVFRHFKNRDEIFASAIAWLAERLFALIEPELYADSPASERLERLLHAQLAFVEKHKGLPRILFSDRLHLESPVLKKAVRAIMARYIEYLAQLIAEGQGSGDFRADLDPKTSARFVLGAVQGVLMRWSIFDFSFSLQQEASTLWCYLRAALQEPRV